MPVLFVQVFKELADPAFGASTYRVTFTVEVVGQCHNCSRFLSCGISVNIIRCWALRQGSSFEIRLALDGCVRKYIDLAGMRQGSSFEIRLALDGCVRKYIDLWPVQDSGGYTSR